MNFGNDRSFMASASEGRLRRRVSVVVPSNISVNQKLAILKDTITPKEAVIFYMTRVAYLDALIPFLTITY